MSATDLVRASRDGDQFHYLWASRRALLLIATETQLKQITIEGVAKSELDDEVVEEGEHIVDVGEYYGGSSFQTATKIKYYQLKHTTVALETPFSPSALRKTLKGFSERYKSLVRILGKDEVQEKLEFIFVSNRQISSSFLNSIENYVHGYSFNQEDIHKLEEFTTLKGTKLLNFMKLVRFDIVDSYWEQRNILSFELNKYLPGSDAEAPNNLKELITRKALSESSENNTIDKIDVLRTLNTNEEALFPVKNLIKNIENPIFREHEQEIVDLIIAEDTSKFAVQAEGGIGKTVFASHINDYLPEDSIAVVYDCFGNGDYRNISRLRHGHSIALVQIANELSAQGLCHPLIPSSRASNTDYINAFLARIRQASEKINYSNAKAVLAIVVDAADNAQMAAQELGYGRSFIVDLLKEDLPKNVKLIAFCRPYRFTLLDAPSSVKTFTLQPFEIEETKQHLAHYYEQINDEDIQEFHRLTSQNPRVQNMALERNLSLYETLRLFGTNPKTIDDTISELLEKAILDIRQKNFIEQQNIDRLCESIAVLRPLIPIAVLESLSQIPAEQIRSFIADIGGHPIRLLDNYIQFVDEPTETWFRDRFKPKSTQQLKEYVTTLKSIAHTSTYVASLLPQLMLDCGEFKELFEITLDSSLLPTDSALERREVEIQRLQFAIKAGIKLKRFPEIAKLCLKAGGESAAQKRHNFLISNNLDLAARFFDDNKIQEILANNIFNLENKWFGAKFAYEARLLSYKSNLLSEARSKLRVANEWLFNWFKQPKDERYSKDVTVEDIAQLFIAHFNVHGFKSSLKWLNRWKPKHLTYEIANEVAEEFLIHKRFSELELMLDEADNNIYFILGIVGKFIEYNRNVPYSSLIRTFKIISRETTKVNLREHNNTSLHAITYYLIACIRSQVCDNDEAVSILSRYLPSALPYQLLDSDYHSSATTYLTAYVLFFKLSGSELTVDSLFENFFDNQSKVSRDKHSVEEAKENLKKLLPWYILLIECLLADKPKSDVKDLIESAKNHSYIPKQGDYKFNIWLSNDIFVAWFLTIIKNGLNTEILIRDFLDFIDHRNISLVPSTMNRLIKLCSLHPELEDIAYTLCEQSFEKILHSQNQANEIIDDLVDISRAIFPLDQNQSAFYFNTAIEISSKIGDEHYSRWESLIYHANKLNTVIDNDKPELAYRFARCAELTYKYIYEDHFDWMHTTRALVNIHPTSCLAIASRWRDRNFGEDDVIIKNIGEELLNQELISPISLIPLVCLKSDINLNKIIQHIDFKSLDSNIQKYILLTIYKYQIIPFPSDKNRTLLQNLYTDYPHKIDEIQHFFDNYIPEVQQTGKSKRVIQEVTIDWDYIFPFNKLDSSNKLHESRERYLNIDGIYSLDKKYYIELHRRISNDFIYDYIKSILNTPRVEFYRLSLILESLPDKWLKRQAVRECFLENSKLLCRRHALDLYISLHFRDPKLIKLMSSIARVPESELIKEILLGRSESSELLDSDKLFNTVNMISTLVTPEESKDILQYGLESLEKELLEETVDGDWNTSLVPPESIEEAYANYFLAGLAAPSVYTRWLNTHAIKVLGELNQIQILDNLVLNCQKASLDSFTDSRFVYYHYSVLQWLLVALLKLSYENGKILVAYLGFFKANIKADKPHLLIRLYSAKIILELADQRLIELTPLELSLCDSIGKSKFPIIDKDQVNLEKYQNIDLSKVESFGIDFGRYWLSSLGRIFGLHEPHIYHETSLIKNSIFKNIVPHGRIDDTRSKYNIYTWKSTHHSHGSAPRVEDLEFYVNFHSMMITADHLLQTIPIVGEDWYSLSDWLSEYDFSSLNTAWLSEYRDITPQITSEWHKNIGQYVPSWEYSISPSDFDEHFDFNNDWLPVWGYWEEEYDYKEKEFQIRSSFVSKNTSLALFRSLKTYENPHNYCLPSLNQNDFIVDEGRFQLKPWISESEWVKTSIFEFDPWSASLNYKDLKPSDEIIQLMNLSCDALKKLWFDKDGNEVIRITYWGEFKSPNQQFSNGNKVMISKRFLLDLLTKIDMAMIFSLSVEQRLNSRYGKDKKYYDEFGYIPNSEKVYLITHDGILHGK